MMNHEEIFFFFVFSVCITLCFSLCFSLCLFSLSPPILYVIFNELLCAPSAPSRHSDTSTSSILLRHPVPLLSSSLLPAIPSPFPILFIPLHHPSFPPLASLYLSLFSMYITVYSLGGSPGGIYGNRIARQQPFLPSFPVPCSSGNNQPIKR